MTGILQIAIFDIEMENIRCIRKILTDIAIQENIELQINWITTMDHMAKIPEWTADIPLVLINLDMGTFVPTFGLNLYRSYGCWIMYYASGKRDLEIVLASRPAAFHADLRNAAEFRLKFLQLHQYIVESRELFVKETKGETLRVFYRNILYFESCRKQVILHTVLGKLYEFRGKLSMVEEELRGNSFLRVHQSFLVNTYHIERLEKGNKAIVLVNDKYIPVSKSCYEEVVEHLQDRDSARLQWFR